MKEAAFPARHAFLCITCVFLYMHTGFSPWQFMFQHTSLRSMTGKTFCLSMSLFPGCMIPPHFFAAAISLLLYFLCFCDFFASVFSSLLQFHYFFNFFDSVISLLLHFLYFYNFFISVNSSLLYFAASAFLYISFRYFLPRLRLSCFGNRSSHRRSLPEAVFPLHRIRNR